MGNTSWQIIPLQHCVTDWMQFTLLYTVAEFQNERVPHRFMHVEKQVCAAGELYRNTTFEFSLDGQPASAAGGATSGESSIRQYETYHGTKVQLRHVYCISIVCVSI